MGERADEGSPSNADLAKPSQQEKSRQQSQGELAEYPDRGFIFEIDALMAGSMSLPDLSGVIATLNALSSLAVIAGVAFVVFQLRQNQKLIRLSNKQAEANLLQAKSGIALGIVQQFTDEPYTRKRKTMRDIVKKYVTSQWEGFDDSLDDFELRAFGSYYEFIAYFAKEGVVELRTLQDVLGHRITLDWDAFYPAVEYYRTKGMKRKYIFKNFEWLQQAARRYLDAKEKEL